MEFDSLSLEWPQIGILTSSHADVDDTDADIDADDIDSDVENETNAGADDADADGWKTRLWESIPLQLQVLKSLFLYEDG